jgi:hypothetical protein
MSLPEHQRWECVRTPTVTFSAGGPVPSRPGSSFNRALYINEPGAANPSRIRCNPRGTEKNKPSLQPEGAAAHNVDGASLNRCGETQRQRASYFAAHNVDGSFVVRRGGVPIVTNDRLHQQSRSTTVPPAPTPRFATFELPVYIIESDPRAPHP